jgi:hypothetical protein
MVAEEDFAAPPRPGAAALTPSGFAAALPAGNGADSSLIGLVMVLASMGCGPQALINGSSTLS